MWLFLKIIGLLFIPTYVAIFENNWATLHTNMCHTEKASIKIVPLYRKDCLLGMAKSFEVLALGVIHIDWSADGMYLRSNAADYELLFWRAEDGEHLTTDAEMDSVPSAWATRNW